MLKQAWQDYVTHNAGSVDNNLMYWDAAKAYLRGCIDTFVAAYRKHINKAFKEHSENLRRAQTLLNQNPSTDHRKQWESAKHTFDMWTKKYEISRAAYRDLQFHTYGNKAGNLLSRLIKGTHKPNYVTKLSNREGVTATTPAEMAKTFQEFYQDLYSHTHTD